MKTAFDLLQEVRNQNLPRNSTQQLSLIKETEKEVIEYILLSVQEHDMPALRKISNALYTISDNLRAETSAKDTYLRYFDIRVQAMAELAAGLWGLAGGLEEVRSEMGRKIFHFIAEQEIVTEESAKQLYPLLGGQNEEADTEIFWITARLRWAGLIEKNEKGCEITSRGKKLWQKLHNEESGDIDPSASPAGRLI